MRQSYQVTIMCKTGAYKPVSCLIGMEQEQGIDLTKDIIKKKEITKRGVNKICASHSWSARELQKYGYATVKCRYYDKDATIREQAERYSKLKEEKYASGEWERPKKG